MLFCLLLIYVSTKGLMSFPCSQSFSVLEVTFLLFLGSGEVSGIRGFNFRNGLSLWRKHLVKHNKGAYICCSFSTEKDPLLPSIQQLTDARVIYSVSAALGHNKVSFSLNYCICFMSFSFTFFKLLFC